LIKLLGPTIRDEFHALFPARANRPDRWERFLERKAYEIARYVLPIATYTYLYHTVSALTLMRYARLASFFDAPTEQRALIDAMVAAVVAKDELFPRELNDPIPLEQTPEYAYLTGIDSTVQREHATEFAQEFDHRLGDRTSVLIGWDEHAERIMADAVRATLGAPESILSDKEALALLLDPSRNAYYTETMNVHTLTKISRAMNHVTYTFAKKLSHTADSQDQRHRMVPASRPVLSAVYSGASDTVTPKLIMMNDAAQEAFDDANAVAFENINRLLDAGVPDEYAFYLLPNAYSIRMVESGSLMGLHHKWRTRLCYTAQEEIWHATMDEVTQVSRIHPTVGKYMHAPCWFRMETPGTTPYCPEGDRFCGVPVWKLDVNAFQRVL
ncbi:MAG: FAD-dependent thymidylate synthase, partial [Candidatus Jacksonbacteria bacterium]|nr:FAD-dependent thymidylate synthase [Candidatus Jacksonbacteria bacterium]MBT7338232.1 FAD-dependent thymidylate synthase [Candidatus Jacksonbacteria bacterium]